MGYPTKSDVRLKGSACCLRPLDLLFNYSSYFFSLAFLSSLLCRYVALRDCFSTLSKISLADEDDYKYDRCSPQIRPVFPFPSHIPNRSHSSFSFPLSNPRLRNPLADRPCIYTRRATPLPSLVQVDSDNTRVMVYGFT